MKSLQDLSQIAQTVTPDSTHVAVVRRCQTDQPDSQLRDRQTKLCFQRVESPALSLSVLHPRIRCREKGKKKCPRAWSNRGRRARHESAGRLSEPAGLGPMTLDHFRRLGNVGRAVLPRNVVAAGSSIRLPRETTSAAHQHCSLLSIKSRGLRYHHGSLAGDQLASYGVPVLSSLALHYLSICQQKSSAGSCSGFSSRASRRQ